MEFGATLKLLHFSSALSAELLSIRKADVVQVLSLFSATEDFLLLAFILTLNFFLY